MEKFNILMSLENFSWKKSWIKSLLEIVCFWWNHGYVIIENVAEVLRGVYEHK